MSSEICMDKISTENKVVPNGLATWIREFVAMDTQKQLQMTTDGNQVVNVAIDKRSKLTRGTLTTKYTATEIETILLAHWVML